MWKSYKGIWIPWNFTVRVNQDCESQKSRWGCKKSIDSFLEVPGLVNVVPALLRLTNQVTITNWLALFVCYIRCRIKYTPIFSVQGGVVSVREWGWYISILPYHLPPVFSWMRFCLLHFHRYPTHARLARKEKSFRISLCRFCSTCLKLHLKYKKGRCDMRAVMVKTRNCWSNISVCHNAA